jgi:hypothetical protein
MNVDTESFNRPRTEFNRSADRVRSQDTNEQSSTNFTIYFQPQESRKNITQAFRPAHLTWWSKLMIKVHQSWSNPIVNMSNSGNLQWFVIIQQAHRVQWISRWIDLNFWCLACRCRNLRNNRWESVRFKVFCMVYEQENILSYRGDAIGTIQIDPAYRMKSRFQNDPANRILQWRVVDDLVQFQSNLHTNHAYQLSKGMHLDERDVILLQTSWNRDWSQKLKINARFGSFSSIPNQPAQNPCVSSRRAYIWMRQAK